VIIVDAREAAGYKGETAGKSGNQFLKSLGPMLRRFADAVGVALSTIVRE
jgi:hypothetical protein